MTRYEVARHMVARAERRPAVAEGVNQPYRAFLVRWWQEEPDPSDDPNEPRSWRFSLEEVGVDRPRLGFTSLHDLTAYLQADLCATTGDPECEPGA